MKILLLFVVISLVGFSIGCDSDATDSTTFGANMVLNNGFNTTLSSSQHLDAQSSPPWDVAYGLPWIGAGFGADSTTRGYLYMWGSADDGTAVYETLSTPITKGHTYRITCKIRFDHENTTPYTRVRFLAFNVSGSGIPWEVSPQEIASIGEFTQSRVGVWDEFSAEWTADADYTKLEIDCQNDNAGQGTESWARIDDVMLQEKQ
jgi:hypothetical protein